MKHFIETHSYENVDRFVKLCNEFIKDDQKILNILLEKVIKTGRELMD